MFKMMKKIRMRNVVGEKPEEAKGVKQEHDEAWEKLVKESNDYMTNKYSESLSDEEMVQLAELLYRVRYCDEYASWRNRQVDWFITEVGVDACVSRGNIAKERSKVALEESNKILNERESAE